MATFSITENHISTARRRAVVNGFDGGGDTPILRKASKSRKSKNPRWAHYFFKFLQLLAFCVWIYQGIPWWYWWLSGNSGGGDFGGWKTTVEEVEEKFGTTTAMLQVQLNEVDKKLEDLISLVGKLENNGEEADLKLKALDVRTTDLLEKKKLIRTEEELGGEFIVEEINNKVRKDLGEFIVQEINNKVRKDLGEFIVEEINKKVRKDLGEFIVEEINKKVRKDKGIDCDAVREIVVQEIEWHAADGGVRMVDHALASLGAMVLKHSEPFGCASYSNGVCAGAEKMITPSFGEPGQCFALVGGSGFVEIELSATIFPEAVTLEHVDESVTLSRKTAPRQLSLSGWLRGQDLTGVKGDPKKKFLLAEFTYDLEKMNVQTYKVVDSASSDLVDTVRLDVISNYGAAFTCIYRLRVHGNQRSSIPMLEV